MTLAGLLQADGLGPVVTLPWDIIIGALVLIGLYTAFQARADVARAMGFEQADVMLLTIGALAAPVLDVPVGVIGGAVLALNLGGLLVPLLVIGRLAQRGSLPVPAALLGSALVAPVAWWAVSVEPGVGIVAPFPWFLAPGAAALTVGLVLGQARPSRAGPIAFTAGTLGTLVGADLVNLPALLDIADRAPPGTAFVLGGGGAFDLIFLSGAIGLAVSLWLAVLTASQPPVRLVDPGAPALRVPAPDATLSRAEALRDPSPRERCLVSFARANQALARQDGASAIEHAHAGLDALLRAGSPALIDRLRQEGLDPGIAQGLRTLNRQARSSAPVAGHQAGDAVEQAKQIAGQLWERAPGQVRLEVRRP